MIMQDNDPHHMHPDFNYVYYFLILAPILAVSVLYVGWKLMTYLDNRKKPEQTDKQNSETESVKVRSLN